MRNFETTFDLRCGRILEINGLERVIKESIAAAPEALVIGRIGDDFACVVEQPRHHQVAHYHAAKRNAIFVDPQIV